jgi:hypothetical protein
MDNSALDPSVPSQPNQQVSLEQPTNPASKTAEEQAIAQDTSQASEPPIDHRSQHDVPSSHGAEATSSSLGQGDTGALKQKDLPESDAQNYSEDPSTEGEQMRAPGEGDVADAVMRGGGKTGGGKTGGGGEQESLVQNMEAKTQAHKQALHERRERTGAEIEEEKKEDWTGKKNSVDLGRALGGRGIAVVEAPEN